MGARRRARQISGARGLAPALWGGLVTSLSQNRALIAGGFAQLATVPAPLPNIKEKPKYKQTTQIHTHKHTRKIS